MERKTLFVDVMLPLPVKGLFTYRVPYEFNDFIKNGQRVTVQFGRKKFYSALVRRIHQQVLPYGCNINRNKNEKNENHGKRQALLQKDSRLKEK